MVRIFIFCAILMGSPSQGSTEKDTSNADVIGEVKRLIQDRKARGVDYVRMGCAYLETGDLKGAKKAFRKAVSKGRKAEGYNGIGRVYMTQFGQGLRAMYYFRRALGENQKFAEAQYNLAMLYRHLRSLDALEAFEKVLDMGEDHPDAYFQMAQLLEKKGDRDGAFRHYERQIQVTPGHGEARYRLGKLYFAQGKHRAASRLFAGLMTYGGEVEARAYMEMAVMSQTARDFNGAQRLFEAYIERLPEEEQDLYTDISLVASRDELDLYKLTPKDEQATLQKRFWNSRDPAPLTAANERLVEHYRRVAYARTKFSKGEFPWDDRGDVYIRLGGPDHVSRSDDIRLEQDASLLHARINFAIRFRFGIEVLLGYPLFPVSGRWEYWVYADLEDGIEITFENPYSDGRYTFADIPLSLDGPQILKLAAMHGEILVGSIAAKQPSIYRADFADLPIDFYYYPASFRGTEDRSRLEIYLGLPASEVARLPVDEKRDLVVLERGVAMYDTLWNEVHRVSDRLAFRVPTDQQVAEGAFIPGVLPVDLPPGTYYLSLQVRDVISEKSQVYQQTMVVDDYRAAEGLKISDIELAFLVAPTDTDGQFVKQDLQVIPMSSRAFRRNQNAYVYFEIYNLTRDSFGQSNYRVEYTIRSFKDRAIPARVLHGLGRLLHLVEKDQELVIAYEQTGRQSDEVAYVELDLKETEPGGQLVRVKVVDFLAERESQKEIQFKIVP